MPMKEPCKPHRDTCNESSCSGHVMDQYQSRDRMKRIKIDAVDAVFSAIRCDEDDNLEIYK